MTGTLLNVAAVLIGGSAGTLLGNRLPARVRAIVMDGLGLTTLVIGMKMAVATSNMLILLGSVLLGALVGELLRIEDGLAWLSHRLQALVDRGPAREGSPARTFNRGFVMASLVFCIGPMTILGSIEDGLTGNYTTLAAKSILDGFAALAFSSTLGVGVPFAAVVVLLYQGALTLTAGLVRGLLNPPMMGEMTAAGGVLILGIGLALLEIKQIRVGNLLPAIVVAPALVALSQLLLG